MTAIKTLDRGTLNQLRRKVVDDLAQIDAQIAALKEILRGYEMLLVVQV